MINLSASMDLIEATIAPNMLILVHPGSACGSADFNLGRNQASGDRMALVRDLKSWSGGLLVVDGDLSDELPRYGELNAAILDALEEAKTQGLPSRRIFACDDTPNWPRKVLKAVKTIASKQPLSCEITGAWYDTSDRSGCCNEVLNILRTAGYRAHIRYSALSC